MPAAFDVIRETSGGALYRSVKPADGAEPGSPWVRLTAAEYAAEIAAQQAAAPKRQETGIVRRRLTSAEKQALHAACASSWQIADFVALADSEGVIDESDPQFSDAVAALDSLGIIAADRWPALLAP